RPPDRSWSGCSARGPDATGSDGRAPVGPFSPAGGSVDRFAVGSVRSIGLPNASERSAHGSSHEPARGWVASLPSLYHKKTREKPSRRQNKTRDNQTRWTSPEKRGALLLRGQKTGRRTNRFRTRSLPTASSHTANFGRPWC